jgi:DNA repair exonuclease SbcCD ATPase subunit
MTSQVSLPPLAQAVIKTESSHCHCNWKAIGGVALAIIGIAASIFAESIFGTIGFALFGAVLLSKCCENSQNSAAIEAEISQTLASKEKEIAASTDQLKQQLQQAEAERDQFGKNVQDLTITNQNLQKTETDLTVQDVQLKENIETLVNEKEQLQKDLDAMKKNTIEIQAEVRAITEQTIQFGNAAGLFGHDVETLAGIQAKLETQLTSFDHELEGDMSQLLKQIQVVNEASRTLSNSVTQKNKTMEATLQELKLDIDQKRQVEETLRKNIGDLEGAAKEFEGKRKQIVQEREQLLRDRKAFDSHVAGLKAELDKSQNQKNVQHLQRINELQEQEKQYTETITQKINAKKEELNKLNEQIDAKKQELHKSTETK